MSDPVHTFGDLRRVELHATRSPDALHVLPVGPGGDRFEFDFRPRAPTRLLVAVTGEAVLSSPTRTHAGHLYHYPAANAPHT
ncbi:MAG: hypothetical protein ABJA82_01020 [Myxococcales bacterium]